MNNHLLDDLKKTAIQEGFLEAGGVDFESAWSDYLKHFENYDRWIEKGYHGEMSYLARGRDRRANPRLLFPELKSIFCVLLPYRRTPAGKVNPSEGPRYARYLDGPDYHEKVFLKLESVLKQVSARSPHLNLSWKICVDTSAVLERAWGALCGLGWIGKNTLLIHPKHGSYHFVGIAFLNAQLNATPTLLPDYCGNCSRCLKACPTDAFVQQRTLDSRKCIAYWTLEKRGELSISPNEKTKMGTWIAGCDICQEVCPFNLKPTRAEELSLDSASHQKSSPSAINVNTWHSLETETTEKYKERVKNSALSRVKPEMFKRNLEIAKTNATKFGRDEQMKRQQPEQLALKKQEK